MIKIIVGDCIDVMRDMDAESVHCVVTSPPYWGLRDYSGGDAEIGLEDTLEGHIGALVDVFGEVWRVLRDDGTLWINYGDAYAANTKGSGGRGEKSKIQQGNIGAYHSGGFGLRHGLKQKDLMFMPARVAMALQAEGWYVRSEIIWHKPNPMPESVTDRPTCAHEKIFLMSKSARYYYDAEAVKQKAARNYNGDKVNYRMPKSGHPNHGVNTGLQGFVDNGNIEKSNLRNVWRVPVIGYKNSHFATFPPKLIEPCIKAGCPPEGTVLDPFGGAGTTGLVADRLGRDAILIELNPEYAEMARRRIYDDSPLFTDVVYKEKSNATIIRAGNRNQFVGHRLDRQDIKPVGRNCITGTK